MRRGRGRRPRVAASAASGRPASSSRPPAAASAGATATRAAAAAARRGCSEAVSLHAQPGAPHRGARRRLRRQRPGLPPQAGAPGQGRRLLSLGRRERGSDAAVIGLRAKWRRGQSALLPLPSGRGRGEGPPEEQAQAPSSGLRPPSPPRGEGDMRQPSEAHERPPIRPTPALIRSRDGTRAASPTVSASPRRRRQAGEVLDVPLLGLDDRRVLAVGVDPAVDRPALAACRSP